MFSRLAATARARPILTTVLSMAPVVLVQVTSSTDSSPAGSANKAGQPGKEHHKPGGGFINPWPSFEDLGMNPWIIWQMRKDWVSRPVPHPELLPPVVPSVFSPPASFSPAEADAWRTELKATWLGHACFLVEFPAAEEEKRGKRVLLDPVFSCRCSPSQWIGPKRIQPPPVPLDQLPEIDAVVISHNHYDHLDVATLTHIYKTQRPGSVHFFAPLGNAKWFKSVIGVKEDEVSEMDWWEERKLSVGEKGEKDAVGGSLRIVCTPCQHFTGRSLTDRNDTLWASWAIESSTGGKIWFGGDTGYRSVPRGYDPEKEHELPHCPAFKEIGEREGPFDLSMIPIGAYSPRWFMSRIHCNPEDSVELHRDVKSRKSLGMHMGSWVLTDEPNVLRIFAFSLFPMDEPPKRLRAAAEKYGITESQFGVSGLGETTRVKVEGR